MAEGESRECVSRFSYSSQVFNRRLELGWKGSTFDVPDLNILGLHRNGLLPSNFTEMAGVDIPWVMTLHFQRGRTHLFFVSGQHGLADERVGEHRQHAGDWGGTGRSCWSGVRHSSSHRHYCHCHIHRGAHQRKAKVCRGGCDFQLIRE